MNVLLDGFGGLRPIFQYSGLLHKPITIVSTFPYEFALGRLWGPPAHIPGFWFTIVALCLMNLPSDGLRG